MPSCLIVTAYYRSPAKHTVNQYHFWMGHFLKTINNPLVIFCDQQSVEQIIELRKEFLDKTWIYVLPFQELYCSNINWTKDWQRDRERSIHNPNLYIIWNEKSAFVHRAMLKHPDYDFYMWCDIGCFRSSEEMHLFAKEWPSQSFLNRAVKNKMYFLQIEDFKAGELNILGNGLTASFEEVNRIGGTIFLGHKEMIEGWFNVYYHYLHKYIANDYFAGKDQNILATIYAAHPEIFHLVRPVPGAGNPWFYLQRYFLG